ncbi:MAG: hypothetical protein ACHQ4H_03685 [Ktedonobacterales bacterium]
MQDHYTSRDANDPQNQPVPEQSTDDVGNTHAVGTSANPSQAPLPTGQVMDVHPGNLAAAKDALAAHKAAGEAAAAPNADGATIDVEEFRSIKTPQADADARNSAADSGS